MDDGAVVAVVAIVFGTIYATIRIIVSGVTGRSKRAAAIGEDEQHSQRELFDLAMRLQNRVETLERLLDGTEPEWRAKP